MDQRSPTEWSHRDRSIRHAYEAHANDLSLQFHGYLPDLAPILTPLRRTRSLSHIHRLSVDSLEDALPSPAPCVIEKSPIEDGVKSVDTAPLIDKSATKEERKPKSFYDAGSIKGSVFNLASATLGAGALSLPYAFSETGLLLGIILLFCAAVITVYSIVLLIKVRDSGGLKSYEEAAVALFGHNFGIICEVNIVIFCFGTAVAYIVAIGDIIIPIADKVFEGSDSLVATVLTTRPLLLTIYTTLIILPLCMLESMNSLRFTSFMGVASIIFLVITVLTRSIQAISEGRVGSVGTDWLLFNPDLGSIARSLSIFIFAFSCQTNVFSVYQDLMYPSARRMTKVARRASGISLFVYVGMGVFGYLMFNKSTQGNILDNFKGDIPSDLMVMFAEIAMVFTLLLAFPLNIFPCRYTIDIMLFLGKPPSRIRFILLTVLVVGAALALAIAVPGINVVFELLGGTSSAFVCFILPGLFYLRLRKGPWYSRQKLPAFCLVVGGSFLGILSTTFSVLNLF
eukprot:GILK01004116.1.p1 GENE.GILK01004116.1~~GILK01004116.1.p1  ORF type:complete len:562 (+),score=86.08 GILK01004116.1:152-1687(+)